MADMNRTTIASARQRFMVILSILLLVFSVSMLSGCGGGSSDGSGDDSTTDSSTTDSSASDTSTDSLLSSFDLSVLEDDYNDDYDSSDYDVPTSGIVDITFNSNSISGATGGASASGTELTISSAGTYRMTGDLTDGRIIVNTENTDVVRLIFNGIDVACSDSAPVYVEAAERVAIILADGTSNVLTDGTSYSYEADEDEPNAALHSKSYLTIGGPSGGSGTGFLTVNGNYNDGITGKDGLIINGGTITVDAADDGIRGKDYLVVMGGDIGVTTDAGDGLLSDNEDDADRGYIFIEDGIIDITAEGDAIQAETYVIAKDGTVTIESGGGAGTSFDEVNESKKGIKGVSGVLIEGGDFTIDSADDAVHSNDFIVVDDGIFDIATGDDGMHADLALEIYEGDFNISEAYEGIESSIITIAGGNFFIDSDDDGLNCAGGNDGSGMMGPGGGFTPGASGDYYLYIEDGYLAIYSGGDSLDSNGSIEMNGGKVLVHAPSNDNGALDYGGSFAINGGFLLTAGGPGMGESPSTSSTQNYKKLTFSQKSEGTLIHIESNGGTDLVTFEPAKKYSVFIISSPDLEDGTTYNVYFGGSYSGGTETDGLYEGGTYSGGTLDSSLSFTL